MNRRICGREATLFCRDTIEYEDLTGEIVFIAPGDAYYSRCENHKTEPTLHRKKLNVSIATKEEYKSLVDAVEAGDLAGSL